MEQTIPHWLTKQAFLHPEKTAIELENGEKVSFYSLKKMSEAFARKLAALNIKKGTHVGLLSNNNLDLVIAIHALTYLQAVAVLFNIRLTKRELNYQFDDSDVSIIITTSKLAEEKSLRFKNVQLFETIKKVQEKQISLTQELHLKDPFTIMYTSGTTGQPKGVIHTYGNYWWSATASALNLGLHLNDKWLATLPIFHIGGLSIFIRSVIYGISVYLMEKFHPKAVHESIMNNGVTIISVVPIMLKKLIDELQDHVYPSTFRYMLLGGASAPKKLLEKALENKIPVFQSYGMTETTSQIVTLHPSYNLHKIGSSGKPLIPAEVKIIHRDQSGIGEILVRGPMVTKGYYNKPSVNRERIQNNWLHTGDLGYFDKEGFLYVVDRRNDLIISGGENVYPSEIEQIIMEMNGIKEAAVIGKKDPTWGEVPVAFIALKDKTISKEEILAYLRENIASYKVPKEIYFLERLPRNATNKIVREKLRLRIE